ncbi:MAG: NB-ARC domain-containing protein [Methanocellales archaeon]|nr:NB-ARC domain-containing protein [Methanocellales archaeon]
MLENQPEKLRKYGYDILINRFEPLFRNVLINEVLLIKHGLNSWINGVPEGVVETLKEAKDIDASTVDIKEFFEEIFLWGLKEISIYSDNYVSLGDFVPSVGKEKFIEVMDELNEIRKKIAHSKTFTQIDLLRLIDLIKTSFDGKLSSDLIRYIENEGYKNADNIPSDFLSKYECQNNLPIEEYDLDGGFIGRRKEIIAIKKLLYSSQDRIVSITGAGGVGKTAVALKLAYSILADEYNPFEAVIWFSAKETKLTPEDGIVSIAPKIKSCEQLLKDILSIVDYKTYEVFEKNKILCKKYAQHLNDLFSSQRCLLIIDNLETILKDQETIEFIKNIPRPSQVLITSRKGLGEIEKRYTLPDFDEKSAVELFRLLARERNRVDLLKLDKKVIAEIVNKVRCYPLLIKWSIGKVCLGEEITKAFAQIYSGKTEIAQFVFNDIFELFSEEAKQCLYSLIILGDRPVSKHLLMHLSNLDDDQFEDAIRELIIASFVYQEVSSSDEKGIITHYTTLSLTRGFVQSKLDEDKKTLNMLQTRYHELTQQVDQLEKSKRAYDQSLFSLGIKSDDQKIAFNYVKTAKNFIKNGDFEKAEQNFKNAIQVAPSFSYALIEYAKFEFYRGHVGISNDLFEQAINADKENFHSFFSYGICLKKQDRVLDAIKMLEKAKELNPEYLPTYNELGRVYSFNAEFDKANELFEMAKKQKEYINYRHLFITLQYQADNYRRWSEQFFSRKDTETGILKLNQALSLIRVALESKKGDQTLYILEKHICLDLAINLCKIGKFDDAIPYYEKCFEKITLINGIVLTSDPVMAQAYFYMSHYGFNLNSVGLEKISWYIKKGLAINRDDKYTKKFLELKKRVEGKLKQASSDYRYGVVEYFNKHRHYGIIRSENKTFLFLINGFKRRILDEEIDELNGKTVSFTLIPSQKDPNSQIATNINIEY